MASIPITRMEREGEEEEKPWKAGEEGSWPFIFAGGKEIEERNKTLNRYKKVCCTNNKSRDDGNDEYDRDIECFDIYRQGLQLFSSQYLNSNGVPIFFRSHASLHENY